MSPLLLLFLVQFHISIDYGYYLSLNELPWQNASNFCSRFCQSELVSIHSDNEYQHILQLIQKNIQYIHKDIYIGLYRNPNVNTQFLWKDNTTFDFASNTSTGTYPWRWDEPDPPNYGQNCVELNHNDNFVFNDDSCDFRYHFICNECDGVITKYIGINDIQNYTQSIKECQTYFNTTIGSIHSDSDFYEAQLIAIERDRSHWIGLGDKYQNLNFSWVDGTTFDYGYNISVSTTDSAYPWAGTEPDPATGGQHCVYIDNDNNFLWNDGECYATLRVICNMPSELCHEEEWIALDDVYYGYLNWSLCEVNLSALSGYYGESYKNVVVLKSKQFVTDDIDKPLIIEYMFNMLNATNSSYSYGGIIIYYNANCRHYVEIGMSLRNETNDDGRVTLIASDGTFILRSVNYPGYKYGVFYRLKIEIYNAMRYIVSVNDELYINETLHTGIDIVDKTLSGSIGIFADDVTVNAKYLFVSGESFYINNTKWFNHCTETTFPTFDPTKMPTLNPTRMPTLNPTQLTQHTDSPTNIPTYTPSLFSQTANPTSVSGSIVTELLTNISNDNEDDDNVNLNNDDVSLWTVVIIVVGLVFLCVICLSVMIFLRRKKETKTLKNLDVNQQEMVLHQNQNSEDKLDHKDEEIIHLEYDGMSDHHNDILLDKNGENAMIALEGEDVEIEIVKSVQSWLQNIGFPTYYELFISNGYESIEIIKEISDKQELYEIGISLRGHQTKLMAEIKKLNKFKSTRIPMDQTPKIPSYEGTTQNGNELQNITIDEFVITGDNEMVTPS